MMVPFEIYTAASKCWRSFLNPPKKSFFLYIPIVLNPTSWAIDMPIKMWPPFKYTHIQSSSSALPQPPSCITAHKGLVHQASHISGAMHRKIQGVWEKREDYTAPFSGASQRVRKWFKTNKKSLSVPRGLLVPEGFEEKQVTRAARQYWVEVWVDWHWQKYIFWIFGWQIMPASGNSAQLYQGLRVTSLSFFVANASDGALREAAIFCLFILEFFQLGLFRAFWRGNLLAWKSNKSKKKNWGDETRQYNLEWQYPRVTALFLMEEVQVLNNKLACFFRKLPEK